MMYYPPPPAGGQYPPPSGVPVKAPAVAWLVPFAALLAVIGLFIPWFKAKGSVSGGGQKFPLTGDALYSWKDGRLGLVAPILLAILAVGVLGLLVGRTPSRFSRGSSHPVASAGKTAIGVGAASLVCVIIAWFLVKSQYKFTVGGTKYSWDGLIKAAKAQGFTAQISRGPQVGYYLTGAAAVLAMIGGVLMILAARGGSASGGPGYGPGTYAPPQYGPPPQGIPQYGVPPQGPPAYGVPPQGPPPQGPPPQAPPAYGPPAY